MTFEIVVISAAWADLSAKNLWLLRLVLTSREAELLEVEGLAAGHDGVGGEKGMEGKGEEDDCEDGGGVAIDDLRSCELGGTVFRARCPEGNSNSTVTQPSLKGDTT
mmetsp:Transcript_55283/g.117899  ORF Transcript_55283/g.117899 Transcript_55283/m.117899 type:complete len:107 (+) Transcript_55283:1487-1807(+)